MTLLESIGEKSDGFCLDLDLLSLNIALAVFNGVLAAIAFSQLVRIHMRNRQIGWTRQKVLHLMIGCSNLGYFLYFISTLIATCKQWFCWSNVCGFILMAYPKILLLAAFLLLLSFWVDLCHQANDEEDDGDDSSMQHALLENSNNKHCSSNTDGHRICCSFPSIHVGSHQKFVIAVVGLVLILMMLFAVVIWIGAGKNPIDSSAMGEVYEDFLAFTVLLLGGGLGCYGILLFRKLRTVRSEKASSEMWKVGGLAATSVVCFTSSALVALFTDIPVSSFTVYHSLGRDRTTACAISFTVYHVFLVYLTLSLCQLYDMWSLKKTNGGKALVFLILYYFIGSWVPSAFVLWFMRELPPPITNRQREQSRTITFISYGGVDPQHPRHWATVTSSNNQVLLLYCIVLKIKFAYIFFCLSYFGLEAFSLYDCIRVKRGDISLILSCNAVIASKSNIRKTCRTKHVLVVEEEMLIMQMQTSK